MAPGSAVPLGSFLCRKDSASKRKRVNRSAKVKQCKLEEQWLGYQVTEHQQGEQSLHAETDPCIHDPGEVIDPKFATTDPLSPMDSRVSLGSLLNSSVSVETQQNHEKRYSFARVPSTTEAEPDPDLLCASSSLYSQVSWASLLNSAETQRNRKKIHSFARVPTITEEEPDPDLLCANANLYSQVSWASLLNSAETQQDHDKIYSFARVPMTTEAEPDPDLLRANSNLYSQVSWASLLKSEKNHEKMHSFARVPTITEAEPDPDLLSANSNLYLKVSWASLLNSAETQQNHEKIRSFARVPTTTEAEPADPDLLCVNSIARVPATTETEPDPDLLCAKSNLHLHLRIKRPGQKDSGRNSSPSPNPNRCTAYECGAPDVPPKSCGERSPKSKASKVGRGSRRSRGGCSTSKENECTVAEHLKGNIGQQRMCLHGQEHRFCYSHETEDGWEVAADAVGLHLSLKKSSNLPQTQSMHHNDERCTRTKSPSLLGRGPSKQPDLQRSVHKKAWMQCNLQCPPSLRRLSKQRGACVHACLKSHSEKPQCPICTEVLDSTDTLFDSCPCGFSLCLFCYYKIASDNNRCPGCRGVYTRDISVKPSVVLPC